MRILHTSDWHLGQFFYGKSRAHEHKAFLNWLLLQVKLQHIDVVIVAGDIFDTSSPSSYARTLYNQFIVAISKTSCGLYILGGNHDSVAMLAESKDILACLNTQVIPGIVDNMDEQIFTLYDVKQQPGAILGVVPYLRPKDLVRAEVGLSGLQKQQQLGEAIADYYQAIFCKAKALAATYAQPLPIILTGHLTTVGASSSDSVREIYIGSLNAFNAHHFPKADYIALGHIHRGQRVAKSEHIRYSGSPICLSFDEVNKSKQVLIVDFDDQCQAKVTELSVPMFRPLAVIKGTFNEIEAKLQQLIDTLKADDCKQDVWLSIELSSQDYIADLQGQIQKIMTDNQPAEFALEVLQLKRKREQNKVMERLEQETLSELTLADVFQRRLAIEVCDSDEKEAQFSRLNNIFKQIADHAQIELEQQRVNGNNLEQE